MNPCSHCKKILASTSVSDTGTAVTIAVTADNPLKPETKYCLVLAQPVPLSGYNKPVYLAVTVGGDALTLPLKRLFDCNGGVCNVEFGEDLPKCRTRIPLYHTNGNDLIDLRKNEHHHYCRGV